MNGRKYRFAVIGYGHRGHRHVSDMETSQAHPAECVAVADVRQPTREEKSRFGERFYSDHRRLLVEERVDFVVVASYEVCHVDHALAALRTGVPVYLEKAVSSTWKGAVRLYREVVKHSYPVFVGYNMRRRPCAVVAAKLLQEGKIGRVQSVLAHVNTGSDWSSRVFLRKFYKDAELSGDIVLSKLTHDTDFVQHALDTQAATCTGMATRNVWVANPQLVLTDSSRVGLERFTQTPTSHDTCCATGLFENGTAFTFLFTTAGPDYERRYVFNGTAGQLDAVFHTGRPGRPRESVTLWPYGKEPVDVEIPSGKGAHGGADPGVHTDFFSWLASSPSGPYDPGCILTGMIIPTAALESARTGRRVDCTKRLAKATELG